MTSRQLSDKRPDGTILGQSGDYIGFFGKTARVQVTTIVSIGATATTAILKNRLNAVINGLKNLGIVATS